ncbi:MAG: High-affinity branched-chain amino acid transport ATP-binding protein BraG [Candidatus Wolfebacteria bacterium GW2011_GWE1_48_7]|uniref:High-affinity branched-chain amino acid transport ATP-binding protein BraG n=2 Tax=Candidatus Wolfeibacteriota TaxID=1752735 RepID=A0A0G1U8J0_9BACT|nr:MAG: high-affinity branched-chain amino acid transporter ATP-binding protein BraG [Candidatus Wolfebacteria bacterium GW2011_GWB1_47_1]KKU59722.1 MAG: High-affinity branched-chain amino acid transport ATP-binding protein BraG [Candidatus Wolfebacteria bacterium GW2011_GWE2_47_12]KKU65713.1 MAG: High-affinity branched-chain amino acid transport ATP-binding protein BraG [Candidatus Wolfebacteria bacterium GW2011_GWD2_47_17]KKU74434.1 MAG: High-affinity branched-chain amino acid transport ATP-bi
MQSEPLLQLKNISVHYGGVHALDGVNMDVHEGEFIALMGPNGAGKSTVLKAIFGIAPLHDGHIIWRGEKVIPAPHKMARKGIAFVPQGRRVFQSLTVEENLEIGGIIVQDKEERHARKHEVMEFFPVLKKKRNMKSGALSGGEQQMVALARGLMIDPKVLLLDEPSLGLAPKIVKEMFEKIREINEVKHTAIVVVEHNIKSILEIVHTACVLDKGKIAMGGEANAVAESDILEKVFLGKA